MRFTLWLGLTALAAAVSAPVAAASESPLAVRILAPLAAAPTETAVAGGSLDQDFQPFEYRAARLRGGPFWLRLDVSNAIRADVLPAISARAGRHLQLKLFARDAGTIATLPVTAELPGSRGVHAVVFVMPHELAAGEALYARVEALGTGAEQLSFSAAPLAETRARQSLRA